MSQTQVQRWDRPDTLIAAGLLLYMIAAARTAISYDSHLYLASAKSLFWPGMESWYHWIREPLYPLQLRLSTALFGSADLGVVILQASGIALSTSLLVRTWLGHLPGVRRVALILILGNPIVIGIAGFVGQQALILTLVSLTAVWIESWRRGERQGGLGSVVGSAALGAALALTSAILVAFAFAVGGYAMLMRATDERAPRGSRRWWRGPKAVAALALVLGATVALTSWWTYKAIAISDTESSYPYQEWMWEYTDGGDPFSLPEKILAFLAIGPDGTIPPSGVAWEVRVYGGLEAPYSDRCGFEDPGDVSADYSEGFVETSCRPAWASRINTSLAGIGLTVHRIALMGLFLASIISLGVSRLRGLAVMTGAFLLPYLVGGLGISRYAIPLYPIGLVAVLVAATALVDWIGQKRHTRRGHVA